ncbi:hypothetical protein CRI77_07605 [Mycolicibacterium duvalii]|nr:hypothetical protein CRI77_07605 [Mycolicibacterium duvalii]
MASRRSKPVMLSRLAQMDDFLRHLRLGHRWQCNSALERLLEASETLADLHRIPQHNHRPVGSPDSALFTPHAISHAAPLVKFPDRQRPQSI